MIRRDMMRRERDVLGTPGIKRKEPERSGPTGMMLIRRQTSGGTTDIETNVAHREKVEVAGGTMVVSMVRTMRNGMMHFPAAGIVHYVVLRIVLRMSSVGAAMRILDVRSPDHLT